MDKNNLSFSMSQSITEECSELVSSIAEVTLYSGSVVKTKIQAFYNELIYVTSVLAH